MNSRVTFIVILFFLLGVAQCKVSDNVDSKKLPEKNVERPVEELKKTINKPAEIKVEGTKEKATAQEAIDKLKDKKVEQTKENVAQKNVNKPELKRQEKTIDNTAQIKKPEVKKAGSDAPKTNENTAQIKKPGVAKTGSNAQKIVNKPEETKNVNIVDKTMQKPTKTPDVKKAEQKSSNAPQTKKAGDTTEKKIEKPKENPAQTVKEPEVITGNMKAHLKLSEKQVETKERYKILAFLSFPSRSHHKVFEPLLKELALRGHQVTVVTPLPVDEVIPNYKQIVFKNYQNDLQAAMEQDMGTSDHIAMLKMRWFVQQIFLILMRFMGSFMAEHTFSDPVIQKFLQSDEKYDAIFLEASFMQEINIALAHKFNAIPIEILTSGNFHWSYWLYGNPYDTSYIADISTPYSDRMTFLERLHNTVNSLMIRGVYRLFYMPIYEEQMNKLIRYPGWENRPSLMDMLKNVSLVLVNTHFSLNYPYPMSPNFKEVGGLNLVPEKKLPQDLQEFMDGAKDGVIYFSLGSNFNASRVTEANTVNGLVRLFANMKQRVLWKYDEPKLPGLTKNVIIRNWFPQQDILAHKNCKAFITHGGFLSLTESVYYGVPMIGTPILGDQMKNVRHMEYHGYGIGLDFFNVSHSSMSWALDQVLNNPKYRENARKVSTLFRDKPQTALETAVYWTEYAIRHKGAEHLRPAIATMPWYQQAMIDVYAAMALIVLIPTLIFYWMMKLLFRCICCLCCSSKSKDKKIKKKKE